MIIRVDPSSPTPPYEQVRGQIAEMAATGVLRDGQRLPPIRQLAGDLGLADGTVAKAYRELEKDGWIQTRGRHGSYVARPASGGSVNRDGALRDAARAFATRVAQMGADRQEALKLAREELRAVLG